VFTDKHLGRSVEMFVAVSWARLPSLAVMRRLMKKGQSEGWGDYDAATMPR
jgi:hypothetical protein